MEKDAKIYVAGHRGLVGSAIVRKLEKEGFANLLLRTHKELDLTRQEAVEDFFHKEKPKYVIVAAAKVGGIHANNTYPADFIGINLQIQTNLIDAAYRSRVKKLLFLGSSCIYPKLAPQPIKEEALLTGPLEPTNEWYAVAKIAGIKMCQAYRLQYKWDAISGMPTNLYGPHDNFHPENSHVLPALIRRFHEAKVNGAKEVVVWGTGSPLREFLHVDDLADAVVFLMENYSDVPHVNMGSGSEVTIKELAEMVKEVVGFPGDLKWDSTKPDGTPRKLMDSSKLQSLGWNPRINLKDGLADTYKWFETMRPKERRMLYVIKICCVVALATVATEACGEFSQSCFDVYYSWRGALVARCVPNRLNTYVILHFYIGNDNGNLVTPGSWFSQTCDDIQIIRGETESSRVGLGAYCKDLSGNPHWATFDLDGHIENSNGNMRWCD